MKNPYNCFKRLSALPIHSARILPASFCVFLPAFQMMRCFLTVSASVLQGRLDVSGVVSCNMFTTSVESMCSISTLNVPLFVNNLWLLFSLIPVTGRYQFG